MVLIRQGLRESRHARDQAVAAGEQRDEHLVDDIVLPDDDLSQLGENAIAARGNFFGAQGDSVHDLLARPQGRTFPRKAGGG